MSDKDFSVLPPIEAAIAFGIHLSNGPGSPPKETEVVDDLIKARHANEASEPEFRMLENPTVFHKILDPKYTPVEQLKKVARALKMAPSHDMHLATELAISEIMRANPDDKALSDKLTELLEKDLHDRQVPKKGKG